MKKLFAIAALITSTLLAGCGEDIPSNAMAEKAARAYADSINPDKDSFKIVDMIRDNGWIESEGRYTVKYTYNLEATKGIGDIMLDWAKKQQALAKGQTPIEKLMSWQKDFGKSTMLSEWIKKQPAGRFKPIREKYPALWSFIESGGPDKSEGRGITASMVVMSWINLESLGLKDDAVKGAKIPQWVTIPFAKTEKGWIPTDATLQNAAGLSQTPIPAQTMANPTEAAETPSTLPDINPTTGLPMVGGADTMGNLYGAPGVNPTTGLPMMGAIDVGGNTFAAPPAMMQ